jgi:hypothetical protein
MGELDAVNAYGAEILKLAAQRLERGCAIITKTD